MDNNIDKNSGKKGSPKYWLSIEQWRNDAEFQKLAQSEFRSSPLNSEDGQGGWARREFLKLMGASLALTSFGCVRRPAQKIVPYAKRPKEVIPGISNYYSSSFFDNNEGFGLIVNTREGRPIKLEGNPDHPVNGGGMSARAHAHVLSLYDPNRLEGPKRNLLNENKTNRDTVGVTWEEADKAVVGQLNKGGVAVLTGSLGSPSTRQLIKEFTGAFNAKTYVWDSINYEVVRQGQESSFGQSVMPRLRLDRSKVILSIDADFLGTYLSPTEFSRQFAKGRVPQDGMNKLVAFESLMSLTGMNADERFRIKPSQQIDVVLGLLHEIIVKKGRSRYAGDSKVAEYLRPYADVATQLGLKPEKWAELADTLWEARGQSVVLVGGMHGQTQDAQALQVAANFLNSVLENDGRTIDYVRSTYQAFQGSAKNIADLTKALNSGEVKTVIIHKANPVYALPAESGFLDALKKAELVVYTGDRIDETGKLANYVLPDHHDLENWGDLEAQAGVYSVQQPTIRPLYDTRAFQDSLLAWSKLAEKSSGGLGSESWHAYLQDSWKKNVFSKEKMGASDFEGFWLKVLQEGVVDTKAGERDKESSTRSFNLSALKAAKQQKSAAPYELVLYPTIGLAGGTMANVAWLQEFPDPVTKICWDNYICVSPADAAREKISEGQVLKIEANGTSLEAPAHIQPGQADGVLGLAVGYGREGAGDVADGVGVNAYRLAGFKNGESVYSGIPAKIAKTDRSIRLANVQGHHTMEGRDIVIEATLKEVQKDPSAGIHRHKMFSVWDQFKYPTHKWGMVVDLNLCTGCSACIIACQSENNIPVVGKKYVLQGREMHWLRVDRYYTGDISDPDAVFQPVPCMHCDNAPCETVCPVLATVHSDEGTNDMIYNRCVGTRYCANNCPYKVRRFNWFDYTELKAPLHMALNPEVTVRARGVMEKCTFCIHRIKTGKRNARTEGRPLKEGEIKTACQQSCPTEAIVFGDLNNPDSPVAKMFNEERSYSLLEYLNTQPAVRYQTKIRNKAELKGAKDHGEGHH